MKVSRGASQALAQQAKADNNKNIGTKKAKNQKMNSSSPLSAAQMNLSTKAQQMKKATDIAKQDSVDEKKISYFQNLIDNGKYKVDSAKVADKLVDDHLKMPS